MVFVANSIALKPSIPHSATSWKPMPTFLPYAISTLAELNWTKVYLYAMLNTCHKTRPRSLTSRIQPHDPFAPSQRGRTLPVRADDPPRVIRAATTDQNTWGEFWSPNLLLHVVTPRRPPKLLSRLLATYGQSSCNLLAERAGPGARLWPIADSR